MVLQDLAPTAPLPCPTQEFTYVCQAENNFAPWTSHLIFPKTQAEKQPTNPLSSPSPQTPSSSQASTNHKYMIMEEDLAKLTTSLLQKFKTEAGRMKVNDECISITISTSVYGREHNCSIDYEVMFDWCFQREIGATHLSILMKYMSEICKQDGVSGMYRFCDSEYLSPLTPMDEEGKRSDYLANVFGQNEGKNLNQLFFTPYNEKQVHSMKKPILCTW